METYKFYETHTDIHKMKSELPEYITQFQMDLEFNPPFLEIDVPRERRLELLKFSKKFIVNEKDMNTPSKVLEIPFKGSDAQLRIILDEYDALSYSITDGKLFMDIAISGKIEI
jgi:hypothetical protein